jgi:hypothetical protein
MLSKTDLLSIVERYEKRLGHVRVERTLGPVVAPDLAQARQQHLSHAAWMLGAMRTLLCTESDGGVYVEDAALEKANRWLGFVQGVLWTTFMYTIDEMREHVRNP